MLYIFDLDGTLVDSIQDLGDACNASMESLHLPTYDYDTYRTFVGDGVKKLIERALGPEHQSLYLKARAVFDVYYEKHCLDHTNIYPCLKEKLDILRSTNTLAVVTNKPDYLAKKIVYELFGMDYFCCVVGQQEGVPTKPNPTVVHHVSKQFDLKAVYIGDSDVDIYTGKNAQLDTIGVTWGNRSIEELRQAGATYLATSPEELFDILKEKF